MQSSLRSVRFQAALRRSYASTPASQTASAYADKAQASAKTALAAAQRAAGPTGDKVVKHATCTCLPPLLGRWVGRRRGLFDGANGRAVLLGPTSVPLRPSIETQADHDFILNQP